MKKIWIHKSDSFEKAKDFEIKYYSDLSSSERIDMVQFLREQYFKLKGRLKDESREGLRRSIKIVKLI
ncbi:MAG: hypothetical protein H8D54_01765 [Candidatus Omnitrophica bacterium]|nr:hypothetical protein [Candidatus Omnitrophota bacterium]